MALAPLLQSEPVVQGHAAAFAAVLVGGVQFARPQRDALHRWSARIWVSLMVLVAVSSFWIHGFNLWGPFSPIHLLSIMTLGMLVLAIRAIRRGDLQGHRNWIIGLYTGALAITGTFTLLPGRVMHLVLSGGAD